MKKHLIVILSAFAFASCSAGVCEVKPPDKSAYHVTGIASLTTFVISDYVVAEFPVGTYAFISYTPVAGGVDDKFIVPIKTEFYLHREAFVQTGNYKLPDRAPYVKDKIYLLNCAIRQC